MTPIKFPQQNTTIKGDGARSFDLPAHYDGKTQTITACFKLEMEEVYQLVETGEIYLQVLSFGESMQPVRISIQNPLKNKEDSK